MLLNKSPSNLSVHVKPFAICTLSKGWRLHLPGPPGLLFHFVLEGNGVIYGPRGDAHPIAPLHLFVVPTGAKHIPECRGDFRDELKIDTSPSGEQVCQIVAGSREQADLVIGCGIANVRYDPSLDLFDHLHDVLAVDLSSVPQALPAFQGILAERSQAIAGSDAMMADIPAMSGSDFAENFAEYFGRSPMSFVNHVRKQRAEHLLAVENRSIDEIAGTVVYSSRDHFSRAFEDHSGLPPKDFRSESFAH